MKIGILIDHMNDQFFFFMKFWLRLKWVQRKSLELEEYLLAIY